MRSGRTKLSGAHGGGLPLGVDRRVVEGLLVRDHLPFEPDLHGARAHARVELARSTHTVPW